MCKHTFYYFLGNKKYPEIYILHEVRPLSRKGNGSTLTHHFNTLGSFISPKTHVLMSEEEASQLLMGKNLQGWRDMVEAASVYLEAKNIPWFSLQELQN